VASAGEITVLLTAMKGGDPNAETRLVGLVYDDLHALARRYMSRERPDHTLQPTALVHETYLRLISDSAIDWKNRAHFFATAATVMRRILVDYARQRAAGKRIGGRQKVDLDAFMAAASPHVEQLLILDQALTRLAEWGPRQARVVEMMYFGGLTEEEASEVLQVSVRTVKRDWSAARAWLQGQLSKTPK
jgi:RNA polymerase sigma factor (TIGR02999 family)